MCQKFKNIQITGILVSVLLAIVTWLITDDAISSFIVGLLIEVLVLFIDFRHELLIELNDLSEAAKINELVSFHKRRKSFHRAFEDYSSIIDMNIPLFIDRADEAVVEFSNELHNLQSGKLDVPADQVQIKGAWILKNLKKKGFATALVRLDNFWLPESGQYYQSEVIKAAKRGLDLTRIFLIDNPENRISENFISIIGEQIDAGVNVRLCFTKDLPDDMIVDFGIWDENVIAYVNTAQYSDTIIGATIYCSEAEKIKAYRIRDRLIQNSLSYERFKECNTNSSIDLEI